MVKSISSPESAHFLSKDNSNKPPVSGFFTVTVTDWVAVQPSPDLAVSVKVFIPDTGLVFTVLPFADCKSDPVSDQVQVAVFGSTVPTNSNKSP